MEIKMKQGQGAREPGVGKVSQAIGKEFGLILTQQERNSVILTNFICEY